VNTFGTFALRTNTVRSYATQTRTLERLASFYGVDLSLPLSELDLCILMSVYATTHKVTTVSTFLAAVANDARRRFGLDAKLPRNGLFQQTRAGIEKFYGDSAAPARKAPVYMDDLCTFARLLSRDTFEGARDWCACLLAFFGLLRIREYMDAGLRVRDVRFATYGLDLEVLFSKTSLVRTTVSVSARADDLCPSRALSAYFAHFSSRGLPARGDDPLFITFAGGVPGPMSADEFIVCVRQLYARAQPDCPPERYAGHSFRRGGATALKLAGVADSDIQRHGRWRSDAYKDYFDSGSPALRLIATRALLPRAP
jgi:hypothetical protein